MKRLFQLTAISAALLAFNACEQHTARDLAILEKETGHEGPGHGEQVSAAHPSEEVHAGAPAKEEPKFFPKSH
jgi:hypothetical protein